MICLEPSFRLVGNWPLSSFQLEEPWKSPLLEVLDGTTHTPLSVSLPYLKYWLMYTTRFWPPSSRHN